MTNTQPILETLFQGRDLSYDTAYHAFGSLLSGHEDPLWISALLMGLQTKGQTVTELTAACAAMQEAMTPLPQQVDAMDIVGTGGDGQHTLNVSTATAFVVAGCGVTVAKHGNRAASSLSGASDVLSALGINIKASHQDIQQSLEQHNIAFLWAPLFHPGMQYVAPVRAALKIPTIFNFLGPLCNPAGVRRMLLGVAKQEMVRPMVEALHNRGALSVWGVYGADGLDELSITGENHVTMLKDNTITEFTSHPEEIGLPTAPLEAIRGGTPKENAHAMKELFAGEKSAYRDMVVYNAAASLVIAGHAEDLATGAEQAKESLDSGAAKTCLEGLIGQNYV